MSLINISLAQHVSADLLSQRHLNIRCNISFIYFIVTPLLNVIFVLRATYAQFYSKGSENFCSEKFR
jgi:hypothetical protein